MKKVRITESQLKGLVRRIIKEGLIFDPKNAPMIATATSEKAVRDADLAVQNAVHTAATQAFARNKDNAEFAPYAAGMAAYEAAAFIFKHEDAAANYAAPVAANAVRNLVQGEDSRDAEDTAWNAVYETKKYNLINKRGR